MYHVTIIAVVSLILYLLTFTGSRTGIITIGDHRKFWNTVLLITFFVSASAGIFLALHSSYKWNIGAVEKILNWHVNFGIALSFAAIIHLTWHLAYYKKALFPGKKEPKGSPAQGKQSLQGINFRILLFLLGFISGTTQVIFLREILNLSGGYEIAAGAVFACWILISALGAALAGLGRKTNINRLALSLPPSIVLSFIIYLLLSKTLIQEGVTPGMVYTLIITSLSLAPFCIISGYLFVSLSWYAVREASYPAGNSFAIETTGGMTAGILITIVTGSLLGNFQILTAAMLLYYIIYYLSGSFRFSGLYTAIATVLMTAILVLGPDAFMRNLMLGGVKVNASIDSRYGNIAIAEYQDEKSIFYNHRLIGYEQDTREREENIHYAMAQHENPRNILIISGGIDKHVKEALKYESVDTITYVERDPALIASTHDPGIIYKGAEVIIINDDAFSYIRNTDKKYDIILSLLPEPGDIVTNRFYTREYFKDIRKLLRDEGVFMIKAGAASTYISSEESDFLSAIYSSLNDVFSNIMPIKGESIYLLASSGDLNSDIPALINENNIDNKYVNGNYLNSRIISYGSARLMSVIDSSSQGNLLDKPVAVFHRQKHSMKKAGTDSIPLIAGIAVLLLIPFFTGNNSSRSMYSTSLNLAGTEILALILIQSTAGNFYRLAGLLIAAVMAGLALGSSLRYNTGERLLNATPLVLGLLAILFAFLSGIILRVQSFSIPVIISFIMVIIPAVLAGYFYRRKTAGSTDSKLIANIYFADLCGAALGFLVIAGILVPLMGIRSTFFILAFINFASYIITVIIKGVRLYI
ncbi:MAG: hypothetical protein U5K32_06610 [Bacteroidales bacterium]|nr:hypothetical protein [Bacteroidales bacterium]